MCKSQFIGSAHKKFCEECVKVRRAESWRSSTRKMQNDDISADEIERRFQAAKIAIRRSVHVA
jgi:hypothetical protein